MKFQSSNWSPGVLENIYRSKLVCVWFAVIRDQYYPQNVIFIPRIPPAGLAQLLGMVGRQSATIVVFIGRSSSSRKT